MRKIMSFGAAILVAGSAVQKVGAAAENDSVSVYVTIADEKGELAVKQQEITVNDTDDDGIITICDALYKIHEEEFSGGADKGFSVKETEYGKSLEKLWGTSNGGSYGYYVNNVSPQSLADEIKNGDYIDAYVFTDLTSFSDSYCWFNVRNGESKKEQEITLNLSKAAFDDEWNPITLPVAEAKILINGKETEYSTDENGNVKITLNESGENIISAESENEILVPPVSKFVVEKEKGTKKENKKDSIVYPIILFVGIAVLFGFIKRR